MIVAMSYSPNDKLNTSYLFSVINIEGRDYIIKKLEFYLNIFNLNPRLVNIQLFLLISTFAS